MLFVLRCSRLYYIYLFFREVCLFLCWICLMCVLLYWWLFSVVLLDVCCALMFSLVLWFVLLDCHAVGVI